MADSTLLGLNLVGIAQTTDLIYISRPGSPALDLRAPLSAVVALAPSGATPYTLPIATSGALGGIRIGAGLAIDATSGIVTAPGGGSYTLPAATPTTLGGVLARPPRAPITTAAAYTAANTDSLIVFAASATGACTLALLSGFTGPLTVDNRKTDSADGARRVRITRTDWTIKGDPYLDLDTGVVTLMAGAGTDISYQG